MACHPERSEVSVALARESLGAQILRFAQDDKQAASIADVDR